uniref:Aminoglycoside phosphotransferase domain-containing protein n=1 Tax=Bionectria ochroleuca TaxID=29856 RepID=A0A8H7NQ26_BIOOC
MLHPQPRAGCFTPPRGADGSSDGEPAEGPFSGSEVARVLPSHSYQTEDTAYEFTTTTFRKTSRLTEDHPGPDGTIFKWFRSWNHERITNEAKAMQLVSRNTTIPLPRLIDHGEHPDGRRYLITERIEGLTLSEMQRRGCLRPPGQSHAGASVPCRQCFDQAHANAVDFINTVVLPQLATLTSRTRGIDGFVMPPRWLSPDAQPPWGCMRRWRTLPRDEPEYVFQHGDLGAHNVMVSADTLQVAALIDWEHAGFFPPGGAVGRDPGPGRVREARARRGPADCRVPGRGVPRVLRRVERQGRAEAAGRVWPAPASE